MLKDVAGYDLAGVLLGSAGRLALIVAVTFRLLPAGATAGPEPSPSAGAALDSPLGELVRAAFDPARLLQPAVRG